MHRCESRVPMRGPLRSADCGLYTINAGADKSVQADSVTQLGKADIIFDLGTFSIGDVTSDWANCTVKTGTTLTCSALPVGVGTIQFQATKGGTFAGMIAFNLSCCCKHMRS
jgi:hypothetical protein